MDSPKYDKISHCITQDIMSGEWLTLDYSTDIYSLSGLERLSKCRCQPNCSRNFKYHRQMLPTKTKK